MKVILKKLQEIMDSIDAIEPDQEIDGVKFASEAAYAKVIRPLLKEKRIITIPNVSTVDRLPVLSLTFTCTETGESVSTSMYHQSVDFGQWGATMTIASKYIYKFLFYIVTGEDLTAGTLSKKTRNVKQKEPKTILETISKEMGAEEKNEQDEFARELRMLGKKVLKAPIIKTLPMDPEKICDMTGHKKTESFYIDLIVAYRFMGETGFWEVVERKTGLTKPTATEEVKEPVEKGESLDNFKIIINVPKLKGEKRTADEYTSIVTQLGEHGIEMEQVAKNYQILKEQGEVGDYTVNGVFHYPSFIRKASPLEIHKVINL